MRARKTEREKKERKREREKTERGRERERERKRERKVCACINEFLCYWSNLKTTLGLLGRLQERKNNFQK